MKKGKFVNQLLALGRRAESGEQISGAELASVVKQLTELEIEEGGPYSFEPAKGIGAADVGLNLSIAYFLALQEVRLPKLDAFIQNRLKASQPLQSALAEPTVIELVNKYQALAEANEEEPLKKSISYDRAERQIMQLIRRKLADRLAVFTPEVRQRAKAAVEKTIAGNPDKQMALMAYYLKKALGKTGEPISDDIVAELGLANVFFWTAFIIYDDFWDQDEVADPQLLPIANIMARHYSDFFANLLPDQPGFRTFFHHLMDKLDGANAWETQYCRAQVAGNIFYIPKKLPVYGNYDKKFLPASGHILGSLALLAMCGYDPSSSSAKSLSAYFRHYLIAMQLNDDAHDWEEDLARGHLSTVVVMLLNNLKKAGWSKPIINLRLDRAKLKEIFWFETVPQYVRATLAHTNRSKKALAKLPILESPAQLLRVVVHNENIAKMAAQEFATTQALLKEYSTGRISR